MKKTEGRKPRATVPLRKGIFSRKTFETRFLYWQFHFAPAKKVAYYQLKFHFFKEKPKVFAKILKLKFNQTKRGTYSVTLPLIYFRLAEMGPLALLILFVGKQRN
jgi:hypothetical protein